MNVGFAELLAASDAVLPVGLDVSDQRYVSGSPLASRLALPSRVTVDPVVTFCATPAIEIGG